jgi:hypothetical protein
MADRPKDTNDAIRYPTAWGGHVLDRPEPDLEDAIPEKDWHDKVDPTLCHSSRGDGECWWHYCPQSTHPTLACPLLLSDEEDRKGTPTND